MDTRQLVERLQVACATLAEVQELALGLPEHRNDAIEMSAHLTISISYLSELALNLAHGREPYDAVLTTARGETKLT